MQRFFKTGVGEYGAGDCFLGITVPTLRRLARAHSELSLGNMATLLRSEWHEARLLALLILVRQYAGAEARGRWAIYRFYLKHRRLVNNWGGGRVQWTLWGWKFALGIVGSIYVHEMGHVAALRRYGIKASVPMFIPGLGAVIRLRQHPATASEDARVGLAGPAWGLGAASAAQAIYPARKAPIWGAIAHFGAWVNLFNLLPVWQLDGGRGFRALTRRERWVAAGALVVIWLVTGEPLLVLLAVAAVAKAFSAAQEEPDTGALGMYVGLALVLAALSRVPVPVTTP